MTPLNFALLSLAAWGSGESLLRLIRMHPAVRRHFAPPVPGIIRWALGVGMLGTIGLLGAWAAILPRPVAIGVLLAAAAGGCVALGRGTWRDLSIAGFDRRSPADLAGLGVCAAALLYHVRLAWSPQLTIDDFAYHVTMPRQYLLEGRLFPVPYDLHPHLHCLWEMAAYFGYALLDIDFITPKLFQVAALAGVAALLASELRRLGHRGAGWTVAAWWLLMQESVEFAPTAQIEIAVAFQLFLGFLLLARALAAGRADRRRLLLLAAIVFGFANGTKNSAMIYSTLAAVLAAVFLAVHARRLARRSGRNAWRPAAVEASLAAAAGLLVTAPWLLKNLVFTGNPFYPFLPDLLPPRVEYAQVARDFLGSYDDFDAARPAGSDFLAGIARQFVFMLRTAPVVDQFRVFSAFLVAVALWRIGYNARGGRAWRFLLLAALAMAPLVILSPARRFVLGVAGLQLLLIGGALGSTLQPLFHRRPRVAWLLVAALIAYFLPAQLGRTRERAHGMHETARRAPTSLYLTPRAVEAYFATRADHEWARTIAREVGRDGRLLTTANTYANAWLPIRLLPAPNMHGRKMLQLMAEAEGRSPAAIAAALRDLGVTHVFTREGFDTSDALREFRARWLEPLATRDDATLYRLREDPLPG